MSVRKEFIVNRNGKDFVLYAGLLEEAHERGLKAISIALVQIPSDLNGNVAIVHATVETAQGTFNGLGDASPENVSRMILPHMIRMAETRAKARALRDAINVGITALDELAGTDDDENEAPPIQRSAPVNRNQGLRALEPEDVVGPEDGDEDPFDGYDAQDTDQTEPVTRNSASGQRAGSGGYNSSRSGAPAQATSRSSAPSSNRSAANGQQSYQNQGGSGNGGGNSAPATPKQLQTIQRMAKALGKNIKAEDLSRAKASEIISSLIGEMDANKQ